MRVAWARSTAASIASAIGPGPGNRTVRSVVHSAGSSLTNSTTSDAPLVASSERYSSIARLFFIIDQHRTNKNIRPPGNGKLTESLKPKRDTV